MSTQNIDFKKAVSDLKAKVADTIKKIQKVNSEKYTLFSQLYKIERSGHELSSVKEGTDTYEVVGSMFLRRDVVMLKNRFENQKVALAARIKELTARSEYLDKSLKKTRKNMKEMAKLWLDQTKEHKSSEQSTKEFTEESTEESTDESTKASTDW